MLASNIPGRISVPFANSGAKTAIPVASQIGITAGAASYTDGFPPLTRTPIAAGGVPPFGEDFNGILNAITLWQQWQSAGGTVSFDSSFSTAIGGYPRGAILASASTGGVFWVSTADNNTTDPEGGSPANWSRMVAAAAARDLQAFKTAGAYSWTVVAGVYRVRYRIWGGGGGSGGANPSCSTGGGGAGEYREGWMNVVPGGTITGSVGAAGTAGGAGGTGGDTTILYNAGAIATAKGGTGSAASTSGAGSGGAGGTGGSGGTLVVPGNAGANGATFSGAVGGGPGGGAWGAPGPAAGIAASLPGTGAGGIVNASGLAGAPGMVLLDY